jgi:hypothetical protein
MKDFLCKAHSANLSDDYTGWILSRKLNGFSMLWDGGISTGKPIGHVLWGKERANEDRFTKCTGLWTSDGHIIHATEWWYKDFPEFAPLQGECWFNDNKSYSSVCNCTAKNSLDDSRWYSLKFVVYNYKPYSLFMGVIKDFHKESGRFNIYYPNIRYNDRLCTILDIMSLYQFAQSNIINLIDFYIVNQDGHILGKNLFTNIKNFGSRFLGRAHVSKSQWTIYLWTNV